MVLWHKSGKYNVKEHLVVVAPGALFPNVSEWIDASGKPVLFSVVFRYGKTDDLPSNLAQYLIDSGFGQESRIILG